ncbi:peptide ABC transporter permease [Bacillus pseudomycoides]|uniref:oligopeptide ABC transporter permease n=1 Tax=Bacillus pseudomycoides TaxID=64104 RepID=UPI000BEC6BCB|nr:oligopeptide ABC transporter permease [Bacillus pseudomycoides]PDX99641.1 peptide ABC transporter permease [Bacillus pseudomycoides]PEK74439.1 peptide ABC transporter permease [Bacillus pseudomycoides]PEN04427.1 peptide ABC transporter permease [Bacillus pseudomycoides]PGB92854.1 peptide ABC transporter permease [Bacillus pseudomycoides]PHE54707.1 peptide ABC transporter permease [Bacillus pseudomycoides]
METIVTVKKKEKRKGNLTSPWRQAFTRIKKNKLALFGFYTLIFMFVFCFIGPFFSPYVSGTIQVTQINKPPNFSHWLGTDQLGRDILTRLMQAGRISLTIGLASMLLSVILGALLGAISGFYRGIVDHIIMRIADVLMSIPGLPLLIIMGAILSEWKLPSEYRLYVVMTMLSLIGWPGLARLVRGQILTLREQSFMQAADVLGLKDYRKILHHLIPNVFPLLIVVATLGVAGAILSESALSYLGLGVVPPTPSWGNMISAANSLIDFQKRPWLWIPPGFAIFITVVSINLLGDALRDALDPKMKR